MYRNNWNVLFVMINDFISLMSLWPAPAKGNRSVLICIKLLIAALACLKITYFDCFSPNNKITFEPRYRSIFGKSHSEDKDEKTPAGSVNLLDDTLLESPSSVSGAKMSQSLPYK